MKPKSKFISETVVVQTFTENMQFGTPQLVFETSSRVMNI